VNLYSLLVYTEHNGDESPKNFDICDCLTCHEKMLTYPTL